MVLNKTTSYALQILIRMNLENERVISAQYLHDRLGIKRQYLRRLLTDLSKHGFIQSTLGRNGGYVFARRPEKIYVYEVIDAIEGFSSFEGCLLGVKDCRQSPQCVMHGIWEETRTNMLDAFRKTTIAGISSTAQVDA